MRHVHLITPALILLFISILPLSAIAEKEAARLTIERIFDDPSLSGPSPRSLKISPDGSRVTFLKGKDTDAAQLDLWEYNIADGVSRLLVDSQVLLPGEVKLSAEERARRERQRISAFSGIVEYSWSEDGTALLFPLAGDIYLYDLTLPPEKAMTRLTETGAFETDARFSPLGNFVSFIRDKDLFVITRATGGEHQLTKGGGGVVSNGMAEFVAQEEMHRFTGYWWSDDEKYIAFETFDESPVPVAKRYEINAEDFVVTEQRYPAAGDPNVLVGLGVVTIAGKKAGDITWIDLGAEKDIYLARVDWYDGEHLIVQRQSRNQQSLDLLLANVRSGEANRFMREVSDTWVELHEDLRVLKKSQGFVWKSARDGFPHLYVCDTDSGVLTRLTKGDWCVEKLLGVDEEAGLVYFMATKETVLERHLYTAALDGSDPDSPRRITSRSGVHYLEFAEDCSIYIDKFSNTDTPPQVSVHRADGTRITWLEENALSEEHPYFPYSRRHAKVEFGTLKAEDGQDLYYSIIKPVPFDPDRRYPVFVDCYGGPRGQQVYNNWRGVWSLYSQYLARHGYVVFTLDNRGTGHRGKKFDDPIYGQLGKIEVDDQAAGARFLATLPYVDPERIGIFGWSYGGYMVLMTMTKVPGLFHAGASVAPVTDYRLYDTHYTERYLGLPGVNSDGYEATSVFPWLDALRGPLLVVHGMADDNVLFTNSTRLFKELQDRVIPFEMMTYPGKKHSITGKATRTHLFETITSFMDRHLKE
ncbi:MAG: S9 family peptidase [Candidatus Krumholzibacteriota bacterium]|nr:S9 family peptidase [Candidatus Krumholzibacteriota bacterium]